MLRQPLQNEVERAARFARGNHGDEDRRKVARMTSQGIGETDATLDLPAYLPQRLGQALMAGMLNRELQGAIEWHAGREQRGGAARPQRDGGAAVETACRTGRRLRRGYFVDGDGIQLPARQVLQHFPARRSLHGPFDELAAGSRRAVAIANRHASPAGLRRPS